MVIYEEPNSADYVRVLLLGCSAISSKALYSTIDDLLLRLVCL